MIEEKRIPKRRSYAGEGNPFYGKKHTEETKKKISLINKGKKRLPFTQEHKTRIKFAKIGKKNPNWKGNKIRYGGLHDWVRRNKLYTDICERCHKNKSYDLANISGKYKRDVNDFRWLCRKCHMESDGRLNNLKQFKK